MNNQNIHLRKSRDDEYDIRCLYHTVAVFDKVKNLTCEEKENVIKRQECASFKKSLTEEEYNSMVDAILMAQEEEDTQYEYCQSNLEDDFTKSLTLDAKETKSNNEADSK